MPAMPMRKLRLWRDKIETEVAIFGDGPPLPEQSWKNTLDRNRRSTTRSEQDSTCARL
jgi:hypothetical protein